MTHTPAVAPRIVGAGSVAGRSYGTDPAALRFPSASRAMAVKFPVLSRHCRFAVSCPPLIVGADSSRVRSVAFAYALPTISHSAERCLPVTVAAGKPAAWGTLFADPLSLAETRI